LPIADADCESAIANRQGDHMLPRGPRNGLRRARPWRRCR